MDFKIEKNVPVPKPRQPSNRYPFPDMEAGDSFAFSGDDLDRRRVGGSARAYGMKHKQKFTVRKTGDGIYRCWRIE